MLGTWLAALLLAASALRAEELVSYSSSASGTNGWRSGGLRIEATHRVLRMTLDRDGDAAATLDRHCAALPRGLIRWFGRVEGSAIATVQITVGDAVTNLMLRGWDEPADFAFPAAATGCGLAVHLNGEAGAVLHVRELLVTGSLDLDPPLLTVQGRDAESWQVHGEAAFSERGLEVRGPVETRARFARTPDAIVMARLAEVSAGGVQVLARAWGGAGEELADVVLGVASQAGLYRFDVSSVAWPEGGETASLLVAPAERGGSGVVTEVIAGRIP